jgi:pimeloyl-ACP methyl ester carboxylesterase
MNGLAAVLACLAGDVAPAEAPDRLTPFRRELAREGALRDLEVDGYRYAVADLGEGPAVVLLHGLGGSIYDWRHLIRPLSERHRVVAVDLLGAGESDRPAGGDYTLGAQARRLKGILDALGIGKATFVGNSYGGGVALRFAQDWPERTDRLVLINSICYPDVLPAYVPLCRIPGADRLAEIVPLGKLTQRVLRGCGRTIGTLSEEELETYVAEVRGPGRRAAVVRFVRAVLREDAREFQARLGSVRAPALLIWGAADRTVPVELGRRLARDLPEARLVELDAGHIPNQECPGAVAGEILKFLP